EELSLRKRSTNEIEDRITIPCTVNGQVAYGDVNRYRFDARKGQRLVLTTQARQLVPYIADAVPGWFQPVLLLQDAGGKEVAYDDDYRFKPDPTILFEAPKDGEYVLSIYDAIYRGREDFVYRVTIGELPFVTSIFPLGGRAGATAAIKMKGWNLDKAGLAPPPDAPPGLHLLVAGKAGFVSNRVPFALDTLPEVFEKESNNDPAHAQKVKLPVIVNGRIDRPDDWDVFQFTGHAGEMVVAEVYARRLDSPLDSVLKLTDAKGALLAFNDDREDPTAGVNTHHADSYLKATLPADGAYFVHLGDTARSGGEEYAYRLRLSAPRPDFALRVVPSSVSLRAKSTATVTVYAFRQDGFTNAIKLDMKDSPAGFSAVPVSLSGTQEVARLTLKADLAETKQPVNLTIEGTAKIGDEEVSHVAVPAEDRMQAFLWRHLVPAQDFKALVFDPSYEPPPKRIPRARPAPTADVKAVVASVSEAANKPKFSKQQVAGRLRQLKLLFEEGLLMDDFYDEKVAECEASR
ncbi:MAG: PPC domain-containing protein, partial [Verrucomicrobia bacterium]|nr:PPC domain-containing protein [Verrucomicrobiota bacterium]